MAIALKGMAPDEFMSSIGVPDSLKNWLADNGVKVEVLTTEVRLSKYSVGSASFPIKLEHLNLLKHGKLGPLTKKAMAASFITATETLAQKLKAKPVAGVMAQLKPVVAEPEPKVEPTVQSPHFVPFVGKQAEPVAVAVDAEPAPDTTVTVVLQPGKPKWGTFEIANMLLAVPVKLRDATMLYQPVRGSSTGSRYFLVAANDDLRIAARLKGNSLSVRIEGPNIGKYVKQIESAGFGNYSVSSAYASMHLDVSGDPVLAAKALGAVLMGLGVKLETPLPELKWIAGKGSVRADVRTAKEGSVISTVDLENLEVGERVEVDKFFPGLCNEPLVLTVERRSDDRRRVEFAGSVFGVPIGRWHASAGRDGVHWEELRA